MDELKQLMVRKQTFSPPTGVTSKAEDDAIRAASEARGEALERSMCEQEARGKAAARVVFAWVASPAGQDLLATMREAGLGRVQLGTNAAILLSDGAVEFFAFAKQWSQRRIVADAQSFTGPHGRAAETVAGYIADGTILDKIAEQLRAP